MDNRKDEDEMGARDGLRCDDKDSSGGIRLMRLGLSPYG